jgi:hypothetical protein
MGVTNGAGTAYPSGAPEFTPVFSGVYQKISILMAEQKMVKGLENISKVLTYKLKKTLNWT